MMYLNRDVPDNHIEPPQDESPVEVPRNFRAYIHNALEVAQGHCEYLARQDKPLKSAVDFWCDMVDDLKGIERDIELVSE